MTVLEILLFIVILIVMLVGLAGVILPILPGIPLIAGAGLLYAIITGFEKITLEIILVFASFTAIGLVIDYIANYFSVRKMGGGRAGAIGAVIGAFIGIFIHWLAIIVLPFVLAVVFELLAGKKQKQAIKAGFGSFVGIVFGGLTRFTMGCIMIGIFVWKVLF
jgi:uncharacterized protein YqgC (DUF456 family)